MSDDRWRGIFKLIEETGELQQALGKLAAFPDGQHPDKNGDIIERVREELTDVAAAIEYFIEMNSIKVDRNRFLVKLEKFRRWGLAGIRK